jgi:hypothetical protein
VLLAFQGFCGTLSATAHGIPANARWTSFDVPGATDLSPEAMNAKSVIAGVWGDHDFQYHGFVRAKDGTIQSFDVPGSSGEPFVDGINTGGAVSGTFFDGNGNAHGFVRARDGTIATFDGGPSGSAQVPRCVGNGAPGTYGYQIDRSGEIVGKYQNEQSIHGLLRAPDGALTIFDAPGAVYTEPFAINDKGATAGMYEDTAGQWHGFVRAHDGTFASFEIPGSRCIYPLSIDAGGAISGWYADASFNTIGFMRDAAGTIAKIDLGAFTTATQINADGKVVGYFYGGNRVHKGFLRTPDGAVSDLKFPKADETLAIGINKTTVMGYYSKGTETHGFLLKP